MIRFTSTIWPFVLGLARWGEGSDAMGIEVLDGRVGASNPIILPVPLYMPSKKLVRPSPLGVPRNAKARNSALSCFILLSAVAGTRLSCARISPYVYKSASVCAPHYPPIPVNHFYL